MTKRKYERLATINQGDKNPSLVVGRGVKGIEIEAGDNKVVVPLSAVDQIIGALIKGRRLEL